MRWLGLMVTGALAFGLACGDDSAGDGTGGTAAAGTGADGSGANGTGADGTGADGSGATGTGGAGAGINIGGTGGGDDGCDKVDFLFIIDNSISMSDQQAALIASFPGFINTIQTTLAAQSDYHIMVADTDDVTRCTPDNCADGGQSADQYCDEANNYACQSQLFDTCDNTIGAGVVHPAGDGATNAPCTLFGDNRYIIEGEPELVDTFSCMALVGLAGHPAERPMDSLVAAMSPELNQAGGCNEGFLRDDAILVVTFISDDPNYEDADGPQEWYDAVVAAKGGNAESVVVLGLTPNFDGCGNGGPPKGSHWSEFIGMWGERGLEASVCNLDYSTFFEQAVSVIDQTCDDFVGPS